MNDQRDAADPRPDAEEILAAARRYTWTWTDPANFSDLGASDESQSTALSAVPEGEENGYTQHLETFAERHRERLAELLRAYAPSSAPAPYDRCMASASPRAGPSVNAWEAPRLSGPTPKPSPGRGRFCPAAHDA
jgi:hypothetical protein